MTRAKKNIGYLIVFMSVAFASVIIHFNSPFVRFSRLNEKTFDTFIESCDRLLDEELPKGTRFREISAASVQFAPEIQRFRPEIVRISPDHVWVLFKGRFAVIWERDTGNQMEWKLTLFAETRNLVLLRRTKSKQAEKS